MQGMQYIRTSNNLELTRTIDKLDKQEPGMVAMCCKSSSGAGVVQMETTLERLGSNPNHEKWQPPQGDSTKQLLYLGADVIPEERKPKVSLSTESES